MARNKETLLLLLDVSPAMHGHLQDVEKAASLLVQRKLFLNKSDEVGLVLFGAEEADNDLQKEIGGYEHVVVSKRIEVVDEDIIEALNKLPRGMAAGDFLDAIVVGMDLLIKKFGPKSKGSKHLYLITGALSFIKEPDEGSKEDQVDTIAHHMKEHGMKLDVVIFQGKNMAPKEKEIFNENASLLKRFSKQAQGEVIIVESSTSLLGSIRAQNISPVTIFRGDLELSPMLRVKVWVYKKTVQEKIRSSKKYSDKAPPNDPYATREVKVDIEYKSREDPDKIVPPEQRIKGFHYGPQVVPISTVEQEALKFKPEKGLKLLGFTDVSNVPRHYYMKDTNIFIPEPGNTKAILAVSALARAMEDAKKVAIVRCVWRQGQANVLIGVLTPNISSEENIRYYSFLHAKSRTSDADVPPLCEPFKRIIEPDPELLSENDFVISKFCSQFQLKLNPKKDKGSRRFWRDKPSLPEEDDKVAGDDFMGLQSDISFDSLAARKIEKVGGLTPIQDFEAMLARRDSDEWVPRAIREMKKLITDLLDSSYKGNTFDKAIDCLVALRNGCVQHKEPMEFNDFLHGIASKCKGKRLDEFWELIISKNVTLIIKKEAADSNVTEEEAKAFLAKVNDDIGPALDQPAEELDEMEQLLGEVV